MAAEASFSTVPDAPTATDTIAQFVHSRSRPDEEEAPDPDVLSLQPPVTRVHLETHPNLAFLPYHIKSESNPANALAFLHNAAKREVADLVAVVIPAMQQHAKLAQGHHPEQDATCFGDAFQNWWKLLLRFQFFVADTNDEIIRQMTVPVFRVLKRKGDIRTQNAIMKQRKSISDRYEFTMEVVFRASERALIDLQSDLVRGEVSKVVDKLRAMARFILDTLELVINLVTDLDAVIPDMEIPGIMHVIADRLGVLAKEDKPVLIYTCARWMDDEEQIKAWVVKYGSIWARMMFKTWQKTHTEQRAAVIEKLSTTYLKTSE